MSNCQIYDQDILDNLNMKEYSCTIQFIYAWLCSYSCCPHLWRECCGHKPVSDDLLETGECGALVRACDALTGKDALTDAQWQSVVCPCHNAQLY